MTECKGCDGIGVMYLSLDGGFTQTKAPCLMCSSTRLLEDIERENDQWDFERAKLLAQEQKEIEAHNKRMKGL